MNTAGFPATTPFTGWLYAVQKPIPYQLTMLMLDIASNEAVSVPASIALNPPIATPDDVSLAAAGIRIAADANKDSPFTLNPLTMTLFES
ncbi:hypothetical protein L3W99_15375 [Escherichia coli]|nr:hypothetical protein [Escherichia coli]MCF7262642.1 hypothetical protein [Escherichia coli]